MLNPTAPGGLFQALDGGLLTGAADGEQKPSSARHRRFLRDLPAGIANIKDLEWRRVASSEQRLMGDSIFQPETEADTRSTLEIISAHNPVYVKGEPRAAFIFHNKTGQNQEICARHVMSLFPILPGMGSMSKGLSLHKPSLNVSVITAPWAHRDLVSSAISVHLPMLVETDPSFGRLILAGRYEDDRLSYDQAMMDSFENDIGGLEQHLKWTHSFSKRFSNFNCKTTFFLGAGVVFAIVFDSREISEMATEKIKHIKFVVNRAFNARGLANFKDRFPLKIDVTQSNEFSETNVLWEWPNLVLVSNWNGYATRCAIELFLSHLCDLTPQARVMDKFKLTERNLMS